MVSLPKSIYLLVWYCILNQNLQVLINTGVLTWFLNKQFVEAPYYESGDAQSIRFRNNRQTMSRRFKLYDIAQMQIEKWFGDDR